MKNNFWITIAVLFLKMTEGVQSWKNSYPVGAIIDSEKIQLHNNAFEFAAQSHNNNTTVKFKLDVNPRHANLSSSRDVSNDVCYLLNKGVIAFYTQCRTETFMTSKAYFETFEMPVVTPAPPVNSSSMPNSFMMFTQPPYDRAIMDILRHSHYKWKLVFYVYDTDEGLARLNTIYRTNNLANYNIKIEPMRLVYSSDAHVLLRALDSRAEEDAANQRRIILDISSKQHLVRLLQQLINVGMNRATYHYLIGGLDVDDLDLSAFQYGGASITGFRLVDPEEPKVRHVQNDFFNFKRDQRRELGEKLSLEAALIMDSVYVITHGIDLTLSYNPNVFDHLFRRNQVYNGEHKDEPGIQCRDEVEVWRLGEDIIRGFKQVSFPGVTGRVEFDNNGFRKNFKLDIMELKYMSSPKKIGQWHSERGVTFSDNHPPSLGNRPESKPNKSNVVIVTSILTPPYLMLKENPTKDGEILKGNARFKGYCADLAEYVAQKVNFTYEIKVVEDGQYGAIVDDNHTWDGMVGELVTGKAHVAIAPLSITSERERSVSFSKPFMNLGISIMIKTGEKQKPGVFSFLAPLSQEIWMCIMIAYMGVSVVLFLVSRFSPYEWQIEDSVHGPTFTNDFTLLNSLWFSLGAFMQQGCDISPRSLSGRVVGSVWWFFTLILISSYTANLAAFLTVERMLTPIESAEDLAEQTEIQYGTLKSGSTKSFFATSKVKTFEKMYKFMQSHWSEVMAENTEEGVKKVQNSKGKYAFLLESTMNDYYNQKKPCNTMKVGANLDSKGYGIATIPDSPLRKGINLAVLGLLESGKLAKLKNKWWYDKGNCANEGDSSGSSQNALTLSNVAGIFYILIAGLGLAMIVSLLEFVYKSKVEASRQKKAVANSLRQNARNSLRDYSEKENGAYIYSAPSQIISFDHSDYTMDSTHTQV